MEDRLTTINRFYSALEELNKRTGGPRQMKHCTKSSGWPEQGVYFYLEPNEYRENTTTNRVVRVGTHALSEGAKSSFWSRISKHKGSIKSLRGGNHRTSIFRLLIGEALIEKNNIKGVDNWGNRSKQLLSARQSEYELERLVTKFIGETSVVWLPVEGRGFEDAKRRSYIERNAIALLSNLNKVHSIDPPSTEWLGLSGRPLIKKSGLWNQQHVEKDHDTGLIGVFEDIVMHL